MPGRQFVAILIAVASLGAFPCASGQDQAPGWTGNTDPERVIEARQGLMTEMERLIQPIDLFTVGEAAHADDLRSSAVTIAQMLNAFPHLFPPTTNIYDAESDTPGTLALPAIWDDFATFYSLSMSAASTADRLSLANGDEALMSAATALRGACDACHALFLLPYTPSTVTSEDLEFDFDALFEETEDQ